MCCAPLSYARPDEELLSEAMRERGFSLTVACFTRDYSQPVVHPLGEPQEFRCAHFI